MFLSPEAVNIQEAEAGQSLWAPGMRQWVTCTQGHGHFLRGRLCPRHACWWKVLGLALSIPVLPSPSDWRAPAPLLPLYWLPAQYDPASGQTQEPPGATLQREEYLEPTAFTHRLIDSFVHGVAPQFQVTPRGEEVSQPVVTPGPCTMKPGVSHPSPGPGTQSAWGGPSAHPRAGSEQLRALGLLSDLGGASDGAQSPWDRVLSGGFQGKCPPPPA